MDKLAFKTKNIAAENIEKIEALFPSCITEKQDENGKLVKAIDFDVLKDCLSELPIASDDDSRYTMLWPGKRAARQLAFKSTTNTLRPCPEESVNFENTENLYIEGDNLEVLKLLRETYLGKVKMIYIDPPYNTGNDFIYNDDFRHTTEEYVASTNQVDEEGNRLVKNTESSGRFHSDWLNMMYPRLLLARDLLSDDGVIFISIDDNEADNLSKICGEILGRDNFICNFIWKSKLGKVGTTSNISSVHEYILCYSKNINHINFKKIEYVSENRKESLRQWGVADRREDRPSMYYPITINGKTVFPIKDDGTEGRWRVGEEMAKQLLEDGMLELCEKNGIYNIYRNFPPGTSYSSYCSLLMDEIGTTAKGAMMLKSLSLGKTFDFSKPVELLYHFLYLCTSENDLVIDFFSGSSTTAHATMQLNADDNGNRKFIMVQLPEPCNNESEAYKAGYKNICEIGKERIRRAGKKIQEEHPDAKIDTGFRVLKLDSSNTKDIYYKPEETQQRDIEGYVDNLKEDRSSFDLLFQVMLELGIPLDVSIKTTTVNGLTVYTVAGNSLIACFDKGVNEDLIKEMAKQMPLYVAFRDVAYTDDSTKINIEQIFKQLSKDTKIFAI